jgi:hypothetical protein
MVSKLKDKDAQVINAPSSAQAHARKMDEFRRRVERISRKLEGRTHSDSGQLLSEDRQR